MQKNFIISYFNVLKQILFDFIVFLKHLKSETTEVFMIILYV